MQYTYFGTCDDSIEFNSNSEQNNKPIELQELNKYMTDKFNCVIKKEDSINDKLTRLILEYKISEAVEMLSNIKDLKFNGDLLNCCYNMEYLNHIGCDHEIKYVIGKIVLHNNYMDVIKLLQFLIPENIIFKESCDNPNDEECECRHCTQKFSEQCNKIVHN